MRKITAIILFLFLAIPLFAQEGGPGPVPITITPILKPAPAPAPEVQTAAEAVSQPAPQAPVSTREEAPPPTTEKIEPIEFGTPPLLDRKLEPFGSRFFQLPATTFAPVIAVPVGPDYILGPGDEVVIDVWGLVEGHHSLPIDQTGAITIPQLGRLHLWGLTYSQAQQLITDHFNRYYRQIKVSVTLGNLRTIKVFVLGEVKKPGGYEVSSLSTLFHLLYLSGGPDQAGSFRRIKLWRGGEVIKEVDLYQFLLTGDRSQDIQLQSNDTIFVPLSERVVGIAGAVRRPAIYELKEEKTLSDLLDLAGGPTVFGRLANVQIERVVPGEEKKLIDLNLKDDPAAGGFLLCDQDLVSLFAIDPKIYNAVSISGSVHYPGNYAWKEGLKVSQVLATAELLPQADLSYAEIERLKLPDKRETLVFKPVEILSGERDIELYPQDKIQFFTLLKEPEAVYLLGEVARPDTYSITSSERLSSVLERAGGFTDAAFLEGAVFTRRSVRLAQQENITRFLKMQQEILLKELGPMVGEKGQLEAMTKQQEAISLLASQLPLGRISLNLSPPETLKGTASDLILEDGDTLTVPKQPTTIVLIGAVNNPGAYLFEPNKDLQWYVERGGGYTKYADQRNIFIVHANGFAESKFSRLIPIRQGDTIIIPEAVRLNRWSLTKDVFQMFYQLALPIAAFND